jgi:hypothetical protein
MLKPKCNIISLAAACATAMLVTACDGLPGNNQDKWRFYQEIHVSGGTSGQADAAWKGSTRYELHENSYYGGDEASGVSSYRSDYEPYKPYQGYEVGSAKQYYRGDTDE